MATGAHSHVIKQALSHIRKNRFVHGVAVGATIGAFVILGLFFLLFCNLNAWMKSWGNTFSMTVYLQDGISDFKRDKVDSFIRGLPGAEISEYISKKQALSDLKSALGQESVLLDRLSRNPLPASYEVIFEGEGEGHDFGKKIIEIEANLGKLDGVEEVQFNHEWLNRLDPLMKNMALAGFVIGGVVCSGVLFVIMNTIKLIIYARKEEIEIQKLIGATDWFVKKPFVFEGAVIGAAGGIGSLVVLFLCYIIFAAKKIHLFGIVTLDFVFLPMEYIFFLLIVSIALGVTGSFIATSRFVSN